MGMEYKHDDDDNLHIFNGKAGEDLNLVFDMENDGKSVFTTAERKIYVKKDGTGDFKTIGDAFECAEKFAPNEPVTIIVGGGRYFEKLELNKANVSIIGESSEKCIIENNSGAKDADNAGTPLGTYRTATVKITEASVNFKCENITFVNSAGIGKLAGQALALYVDCDKAYFKNCAFKANQDTLLITPNHMDYDTNSDKFNRAYFEGCHIEGNVDFIFGGATAVFKDCTIFCKKREAGSPLYITACCTPKSSAFGFVFIDCSITGDTEKGTVYLARPWRDYAKTSFISCTFDDIINPKGFLEWNDTDRSKTSCYEVCDCKGLDTSQFVDWCYILDNDEKNDYVINDILKGWQPV